VLVGMVSLTIVVAQIIAVVLFAVAPFAALGAILPGGGRVLALGWLAALIRVVLVVVGMSFVLSLLLLTIQGLLSAGNDSGIVERFALVNIVVLAMFAARRRILHAGANMAASIGGKLTPSAPEGGWLAAGAVGGITGFALASDGAVRKRAAATVAGNRAARRGMRTALTAESRALQPIPRESTTITLDDRGKPKMERAIVVAGGQPTTRRARAAREKLEQRAAGRARRVLNEDRPPRRIIPRLRRRGGDAGGGGGGGSSGGS
jgi:hypothetical protein